MSPAWTAWPIVQATDWCGEYKDRFAWEERAGK